MIKTSSHMIEMAFGHDLTRRLDLRSWAGFLSCFDRSRYPEVFLQSYEPLECLASNPAGETTTSETRSVCRCLRCPRSQNRQVSVSPLATASTLIHSATGLLAARSWDLEFVDQQRRINYFIGCCHAAFGQSSNDQSYFVLVEKEAGSETTNIEVRALIAGVSGHSQKGEWPQALELAQTAAAIAKRQVGSTESRSLDRGHGLSNQHAGRGKAFTVNINPKSIW